MYDEMNCLKLWRFLYSSQPFIHYGADKENLFDNQEPLKMVIFSLILVTYTFDSRKILRGDFRGQSVLGVKGITKPNEFEKKKEK